MKDKKPCRVFSPTLILTAIFLFGLALRLYKLDFQSFWLDEYIDVNTALNLHPYWESFNFLPPLYIILLNIWLKFFPFTEINARLPSVIIGSLSIPAFYYLGRELFGKTAGLWASFFLAASAIHVNYCQEAKYYPLMLFLAILINLEYIKALKNGHLKNYILYGFYFILGLYAYYALAFFFLIHVIHLWINKRICKNTIPKIHRTQIIVFLFFFPYLLFMSAHLRTIVGAFAWVPKPDLDILSKTINTLLTGKPWLYYLDLYKHLFYFHPRLIRLFYYTLIILAIVIPWRCRRQAKSEKPALSLVILWMIVQISILYLFGTCIFSFFSTRYVLVCFLGIYLFFAWLVGREKNNNLRFLFAFLLIFLNGISIWIYFHQPVRSQYRETVLYIQRNSLPNEKVAILDYGMEAKLFHYYFNKYSVKNSVDDFDNKNDFNPRAFDWVIDCRYQLNPDQELFTNKKFYGINVYQRKVPRF